MEKWFNGRLMEKLYTIQFEIVLFNNQVHIYTMELTETWVQVSFQFQLIEIFLLQKKKFRFYLIFSEKLKWKIVIWFIIYDQYHLYIIFVNIIGQTL